MNNLAAAQSGNRRQALITLRDTLAEMLDTTEAQIHAQLAAQYRATLAELDDLKPAEKGSAVDDAAGRVLRLAGS